MPFKHDYFCMKDFYTFYIYCYPGVVLFWLLTVEPVIWAWPDGPARFHASPRRAGLAVLVEKEGSGPVGPAL